MAAARKAISGVPPSISVTAAAPMAAAAPHSAWQPPSAPDTVARLPTMIPTADAVNSALISVCLSSPLLCAHASRTAGTIPQEPAVGQATIHCMEALISEQESAIPTAREAVSPSRLFPFPRYCSYLQAFPPVRPLTDCTGSFLAVEAERSITARD